MQGTDEYTLLATSVSSTNYVTTVTLIAGVTYKFKIAARNVVGVSVLSSELAVLAATIPNTPLDLTNDETVTTAY